MEKRNISEKSVANNQISCHCKLDLESSTLAVLESKTINDMRGRSRIKYGMTSLFNNGGFTLIELLVVVLIIGILTAVAVPMYKHAVLKSRFSTVMSLAKSLAAAQEVYYLGNGIYSDNLAELDVSAVGNVSGRSATLQDGTTVALGDTEVLKYVMTGKNDLSNHFIIYQKNSKSFPGEIHCEAQQENADANWLCEKGLSGTLLGERALTSGYNTYVIDGPGNGHFPKTWTNVSNQVLEPGDSCTVSGNHQRSCNSIEMTDGVCTTANADSCNNSLFTNSTCEAKSARTCNSSTFNNSTCNGISDIYDAKCSGAAADNRNNFFNNNSVCNGTGYSSCRNSVFTDSVCYGDNLNTCIHSNYNHSVCYGNANPQGRSGQFGGCNSSTFSNESVCYALQTGSCVSTYYDTSYCTGSFCPNNTPSNDPTKKWYRGTGDEWPDDRPSELVNK